MQVTDKSLQIKDVLGSTKVVCFTEDTQLSKDVLKGSSGKKLETWLLPGSTAQTQL